MTQIAHTRSGTGVPLVLLHALGLSRRSWDPVMPALTAHFDVVAVDLPGFGESPSLPAGLAPHPAALAAAVAGLLDDLGIATPHIVGNSIGGWVAVELAALRPAASLTLLSPAGLWPGSTPRYDRISLRLSRALARHAGGVLSRVVRFRLGRALVLGQTHGHPTRLSAEDASATIHELGTSPGFDAVLRATRHRRIDASALVQTPVTVAFGSRDVLLLPRQARHVDQLPTGTRVETLPGCGHVPMADDPTAVAALIRRSTANGHLLNAASDAPTAIG
jgi:pimeloyl-ACP methyl ester carboxylesterase